MHGHLFRRLSRRLEFSYVLQLMQIPFWFFVIALVSMNNLNQQIALVERISFMHNHALDVA